MSDTNSFSQYSAPKTLYYEIITALFCGVFFGLYFSMDISASDLGSFIGGAATALALIWIMYTAQSQRAQLNNQLEELSLQGKALEHQAYSVELSSFLSVMQFVETTIGNDILNLYRYYNQSSTENLLHAQNITAASVIADGAFMQWVHKESSTSIFVSSTLLSIRSRYEIISTYDSKNPQIVRIKSDIMRDSYINEIYALSKEARYAKRPNL